jgi:hypothetical protein
VSIQKSASFLMCKQCCLLIIYFNSILGVLCSTLNTQNLKNLHYYGGQFSGDEFSCNRPPSTHAEETPTFDSPPERINPLRTEVYFCHQNQNAKNIGKFMTVLKPHNIGTHLEGIEMSFQAVPFFKSIHFWVSCITF